MRASIYFEEPNILREAKIGDLFVAHAVFLNECVCARQTDVDGHIKVGRAFDEDSIVVIACRVNEGEVGYQPTGFSNVLLLDTWITFVEPIETLAFRERHMDGSEPPAVAASHRGEVHLPNAALHLFLIEETHGSELAAQSINLKATLSVDPQPRTASPAD